MREEEVINKNKSVTASGVPSDSYLQRDHLEMWKENEDEIYSGLQVIEMTPGKILLGDIMKKLSIGQLGAFKFSRAVRSTFSVCLPATLLIRPEAGQSEQGRKENGNA